MNDEKQRDDNVYVYGAGRSPEVSWLLGLVIGGLIVLLLLVAYVLGFHEGRKSERENLGQATEQPSGQGAASAAPGKETAEKPPASGPGKQLFAQNCGSCHTLEQAGTSGTVGPNLDQLAPSEDVVLAAIGNGGSGSGAMPKDIVSGKQAQQVAEYVSQAGGG